MDPFKSDMINHATSGSEATLHINEKIVGYKVPDKSIVDHSFHGFTKLGRICWILTRLWNRNDNCFPPIRRKVNRYLDFIQDI